MAKGLNSKSSSSRISVLKSERRVAAVCAAPMQPPEELLGGLAGGGMRLLALAHAPGALGKPCTED